MRCPSCDSVLPADARFCIECGTTIESPASTGPTAQLRPVAEPTLPCPSCSASNPHFAVYCVRCGHRLSDPVPLTIAPAQLAPPKARTRPAVAAPSAAPLSSKKVRRYQKHQLDSFSGAIMLFGIALLFFTKAFWPGILMVIGLSTFVHSAGRGHFGEGFRNIIWFFGLTFLFWVPKFFFPGILVLIGLSILVEMIRRSAKRTP